MEYNDYKSKYLFEDRYCIEAKPFDNNIEKIKDFYNNEINFKNIDITKPIKLNKKYDIIFLSNMLEYSEIETNREIIRINLENWLNNNGIAICTYKIRKRNDLWHKEEIKQLTSGLLKLDKEYSYYEPFFGDRKELAYSYKKKK